MRAKIKQLTRFTKRHLGETMLVIGTGLFFFTSCLIILTISAGREILTILRMVLFNYLLVIF